MKKALISGITGFAGSHLAQYLLDRNFSVSGFYHPKHPTDNISSIKSKLNLIPADILDAKRVAQSIKTTLPDYVFHLAAFSSPSASFTNPRETLENNINGQINILEALKAIKSKAKILVIGSADEYGKVNEKDLPLNEDAPLSPLSPYAVSKVAQDLLGFQFYLTEGLNIVRVRPFNHIGPRQSCAFAIPSFAAQIAQIEKNGPRTLKAGNLENKRDFTDVRDMVRAYLLALEKGEPGEVYNIGSGKAVKIADILSKMISLAKVRINVERDRSRIPPVDIKIIYANYSKFKNKTGWSPKIPLETTLFDTIEYEREKLRKLT